MGGSKCCCLSRMATMPENFARGSIEQCFQMRHSGALGKILEGVKSRELLVRFRLQQVIELLCLLRRKAFQDLAEHSAMFDGMDALNDAIRSEERRVGKECRS